MHSGKANLPGCSFHRGATLTSFALMRLKRTRRYVVRHLTCPYNSMHASEMAAPSSSHREIGNPITYLIIRQPVAVIAAREIFSASPFPLGLRRAEHVVVPTRDRLNRFERYMLDMSARSERNICRSKRVEGIIIRDITFLNFVPSNQFFESQLDFCSRLNFLR